MSKMYALRVSNPCCISLPICVKVSATTCIVLALGVIIVQSCLIQSSSRIHHSSLLPLYKVLREDYSTWKSSIASQMRSLSSSSSSAATTLSTTNRTKMEQLLRMPLAFNERDGLDRILLKEKMIRENLELPNLPDFAEIERVSFICGLNGLVSGLLQLVSSLVLLANADNIKKTRVIMKIWIAVSGGAIFSMSICILALLLQNNATNLQYFHPSQEVLFSVLGANLLLLIYFVWINLAYLVMVDQQSMQRLV